MKEFFEIFNEKVTDRALGISFKDKLKPDILDKELKQLSQSLFFNFTNKNHFIYSLEDKNKTYFFLVLIRKIFLEIFCLIVCVRNIILKKHWQKQILYTISEATLLNLY